MSGGGAFGLGKSKSQQQSEATTDSSAYGYSGSQSGDVSSSSGSSFGTSSQSIAFEDLYRQLYQNASTAANNGVANGDELGTAARDLFHGGTDFLGNIGGDSGTDYLTSRLSGDNPVLDEQINQLRTDTGRLFTEQLNPAITSRAVASGTLGGGRQGVAQGLAAEAAARSFTQGVTQLRSQDVAQRDAAAMAIASNSLQGAATGLGALPSLLDLATDSASPELGIYAKLSSILGGPTTLSQSQNMSTQSSAAQAFSRSFGENTSRTIGSSTSSGSSSSRNFNISGYGGVG